MYQMHPTLQRIYLICQSKIYYSQTLIDLIRDVQGGNKFAEEDLLRFFQECMLFETKPERFSEIISQCAVGLKIDIEQLNTVSERIFQIGLLPTVNLIQPNIRNLIAALEDFAATIAAKRLKAKEEHQASLLALASEAGYNTQEDIQMYIRLANTVSDRLENAELFTGVLAETSNEVVPLLKEYLAEIQQAGAGKSRKQPKQEFKKEVFVSNNESPAAVAAAPETSAVKLSKSQKFKQKRKEKEQEREKAKNKDNSAVVVQSKADGDVGLGAGADVSVSDVAATAANSVNHGPGPGPEPVAGPGPVLFSAVKTPKLKKSLAPLHVEIKERYELSALATANSMEERRTILEGVLKKNKDTLIQVFKDEFLHYTIPYSALTKCHKALGGHLENKSGSKRRLFINNPFMATKIETVMDTHEPIYSTAKAPTETEAPPAFPLSAFETRAAAGAGARPTVDEKHGKAHSEAYVGRCIVLQFRWAWENAGIDPRKIWPEEFVAKPKSKEKHAASARA